MVCMFIPFENFLNDFMLLTKQVLHMMINYISPVMTHITLSANLEFFKNIALMATCYFMEEKGKSGRVF